MRDEELVSEFIDGKEKAFEELMDRYQKPMFYFIKAMVLDTEEARDITQKVFIRALNNLSGLGKGEQFRSWLYSIALNLARGFMKGRRGAYEKKNNPDVIYIISIIPGCPCMGAI